MTEEELAGLTDANPGYEVLKLEEEIITNVANAPEVATIEDMEEVTVKEEPKSDGEEEVATVEEEDVAENVKVENVGEDEQDSVPREEEKEEREEEKLENKPERKVAEMNEKLKLVEKKRIVLVEREKVPDQSMMKTMVITLIQEGFGTMTNMPQFQLQFDPTQNMTLKFDTFDKHIRTRESGFTINIAGKTQPHQGLKPIKKPVRKPTGFTNKKTPTPPASPPPPIPTLARLVKPVKAVKKFPPLSAAPDDSGIGIAFTIPKGVPLDGKERNEDDNHAENDKESNNSSSQTIEDDGETENCDGIENGQDMPEVKEEVRERETGGDKDDYEFFTGGMECELCRDSVPDLAGYREHHYEKHAGTESN